MINYKIIFAHGDPLILTVQQFDLLVPFLNGANLPQFLRLSNDIPFINMSAINYIIREETRASASVITPLSPTQLEDEKKRNEEAHLPVTLDDHLSRIGE